MASDIPHPKKGLKINNDKSSLPQPKVNNIAEFNEEAKRINSQYEDYKKRTWELATRFKSMVEDKTLQENKSSISKDLEKEVLDKLIVLAAEMNTDPNQDEGVGSSALSMLTFKMMLIQRDIINELAYKIDKLEKAAIKVI